MIRVRKCTTAPLSLRPKTPRHRLNNHQPLKFVPLKFRLTAIPRLTIPSTAPPKAKRRVLMSLLHLQAKSNAQLPPRSQTVLRLKSQTWNKCTPLKIRQTCPVIPLRAINLALSRHRPAAPVHPLRLKPNPALYKFSLRKVLNPHLTHKTLLTSK